METLSVVKHFDVLENYAAGATTQNHRQIEPSLPGWDVRDVRRPSLLNRSGRRTCARERSARRARGAWNRRVFSKRRRTDADKPAWFIRRMRAFAAVLFAVAAQGWLYLASDLGSGLVPRCRLVHERAHRYRPSHLGAYHGVSGPKAAERSRGTTPITGANMPASPTSKRSFKQG